MCAMELKNFVLNGKKIIGAAFNYKDILKRPNFQIPQAPVLFLKPTTSYVTEGQDITIPRAIIKPAHEVELGVIIGKRCRNVSHHDAGNFIGGYCLALDMSAFCELNIARPNGYPWMLSKGFDSSCPVSRFISMQEMDDPNDVELFLKVNGEMKQTGNTKDLIYDIPELISYTSKFMTLEPNDLILTGTPLGADVVKDGDVIECGISWGHNYGSKLNMKFNVKQE